MATRATRKQESGERWVAVKVDGVITVHAPAANGDYYTLCGEDGDDPAIGMSVAEVPKGAKIDCIACWNIFQETRKLRATDFAARPR